MEKITGIFGAPVTPFLNNKIDHETFAKQINFLIKSGVDAIAYPMHIGESHSLRESEYKDAIEVFVKTVNNRVPTFVNTSSASTDYSINLAEFSRQSGSTGIVLLPPYHWRPSSNEIIEHFVSVSNAHGGKMIAYNNQGATGITLSIQLCEALLKEIPGFVGIKDASFNVETFSEFCDFSQGTQIAIYTGIEHLLTSIPIGGSGTFSACSEVTPRLIRDLYQSCVSLDISKAHQLQMQVRKLLACLMQTYPATIKYAMELVGRPVGSTRAPIRSLNISEKEFTKKLLLDLGVFEKEQQGW